MSVPIAVYRSCRFSHFLKLRKARGQVASGRYSWRDSDSIEEVESVLTAQWVDGLDGSVGVGNLLPLSRIQDPMRKPEHINYPIPAVGARSRPQWCHQINEVPEILPA
jgi:hypothetical protein